MTDADARAAEGVTDGSRGGGIVGIQLRPETPVAKALGCVVEACLALIGQARATAPGQGDERLARAEEALKGLLDQDAR